MSSIPFKTISGAVSFITQQVADKVVNITHPNNMGEKGIFETIPPSPRVFFRDYLKVEVYPKQLELIDAVFGINPKKWSIKYDEFDVLWGMGSGKDYTSALISTYAPFWLMHLRDPVKSLKRKSIGNTVDHIDMGNISINARLAKDVYFKYLVDCVRSTINPESGKNWFEEHGLDLRPNKDILQRQINFPKGLTSYSLDSEEQTGIGLNLLLITFDEIGGFQVGSADKIFKAIVRTQISRFGRAKKSLLLSFMRDPEDFMTLRYETNLNNPRAYCTKAATWEVNLGVNKEDFMGEYREDPEGAQMTYECRGELGHNSYFRFREAIRKNVNYNHFNPLKGAKSRIIGIENIEFEDWWKGDPNLHYYAHVDLAKGQVGGDCVGIALGHGVEGMPVRYTEELLRYMSDSGFTSPNFKQSFGSGVYIDLMLQLRARQGREVEPESIFSLFDMIMDRGFHLRFISYDGWQSWGETTRWKNRGIESEETSADKTAVPYDTLKSLLYGGLLDYYPNLIFMRELEELQKILPKTGRLRTFTIDHPEYSPRRAKEEGDKKGSKDLADAVACVCFNIIENWGNGSWGVYTGDYDIPSGQYLERPDDQLKRLEEEAMHNAKIRRAEKDKLLNAPLVHRGEVPGDILQNDDSGLFLG